MTDAMNKCMPTKTIKLNKHKHKKTLWITRGIVKSIKYRDQLYQKLKKTDQNSVEHQIIALNLKTYNKILKNNIRLAKMNYYTSCFEKCKHDIKKTWETINDVMNRERKSELPESFNINGQPIKDHKIIANQFNSYFSNIGNKLASEITIDTNETYDKYLTDPSLSVFSFHPIDEQVTLNIIDKTNSKTSQGHDGLSTKLLKSIKNEIALPVTLIVN